MGIMTGLLGCCSLTMSYLGIDPCQGCFYLYLIWVLIHVRDLGLFLPMSYLGIDPCQGCFYLHLIWVLIHVRDLGLFLPMSYLGIDPCQGLGVVSTYVLSGYWSMSGTWGCFYLCLIWVLIHVRDLGLFLPMSYLGIDPCQGLGVVSTYVLSGYWSMLGLFLPISYLGIDPCQGCFYLCLIWVLIHGRVVSTYILSGYWSMSGLFLPISYLGIDPCQGCFYLYLIWVLIHVRDSGLFLPISYQGMDPCNLFVRDCCQAMNPWGYLCLSGI